MLKQNIRAPDALNVEASRTLGRPMRCTQKQEEL